MNFGQSLSIFVNGRATIPFEEHANLYLLKEKTFDFCAFDRREQRRGAVASSPCSQVFQKYETFGSSCFGNALEAQCF